MVAPLDAKVTFEVEGEPITLRLNFRTMALAKKHGIDLVGHEVAEMDELLAASLVKCLAVEDHPEFTEDHVMMIAALDKEAMAKALVDLFAEYGGKVEGNRTGRKAKQKIPA